MKTFQNFARAFHYNIELTKNDSLTRQAKKNHFFSDYFFLFELQKQINQVFVTNYNLGLPDGLKETVRHERETIS